MTAIRAFALALLLLLSGCAAFVERATTRLADDLELVMRAYPDPSTVSAALPAYLMLLEARVRARPDDVALRLATARLTATHASLLDPERSSDTRRHLTTRALMHARRGACSHAEILCDLDVMAYDDFEQRLSDLRPGDLDTVYVLATSWVSWIEAHSGQYSALADLPRAELLLDWVVAESPEHDDGLAWLYLAVLHSQRPPKAGGRPDLAAAYFERARSQSSGRNLLVDVLMADHYARLLFDRELYVELLESVLDSEIDDPEYRLINELARQRAAALLDQTEQVFD
ncbi:MAG: hypothetical protein HND55_08740 [Pseudomonadota bacterium]|nr:MAG: hypothetical protein HND55_08740 [Pseudomonadota bacterium]